MLGTWSLCNLFLDFSISVQSEGTGWMRPLLTTPIRLTLQHWLFSPFWTRGGLSTARCLDLCLLLSVWRVPKVVFSQISRDSWASVSATTSSSPPPSPVLCHLSFSPGGWLCLPKQQNTVHSLSLWWFVFFCFLPRQAFPYCLAKRTSSIRGQAKARKKSPDFDPK